MVLLTRIIIEIKDITDTSAENDDVQNEINENLKKD